MMKIEKTDQYNALNNRKCKSSKYSDSPPNTQVHTKQTRNTDNLHKYGQDLKLIFSFQNHPT